MYLPAGTWVDFWTGQRLTGPAHVVAEAPLHRLPLYVRDGAILPMGPAMDYVGVERPRELTLAVYAGAPGRLDLYEDDGETLACRRGVHAVTPITLDVSGEAPGSHGRQVTLTVGDLAGAYRPPREAVTVRLYLPVLARSVRVNGEPVNPEVDSDGAVTVRVLTPEAEGFVLMVEG